MTVNRRLVGIALLALLFVPVASAGDVSSSEASGQLGVGVDGDDDNETFYAQTHKDTHNNTHEANSTAARQDTLLIVSIGIVAYVALLVLLILILRATKQQ